MDGLERSVADSDLTIGKLESVPSEDDSFCKYPSCGAIVETFLAPVGDGAILCFFFAFSRKPGAITSIKQFRHS